MKAHLAPVAVVVLVFSVVAAFFIVAGHLQRKEKQQVQKAQQAEAVAVPQRFECERGASARTGIRAVTPLTVCCDRKLGHLLYVGEGTLGVVPSGCAPFKEGEQWPYTLPVPDDSRGNTLPNAGAWR